MRLWTVLRQALAGWQMILRGEPDWRTQFSLTPAGLATALSIYAFVAFLAVAIAATSIGMPGAFGVLAAMVVLALPVIALALSLLLTRNFLKSPAPLLPVLVPGIYALTAFLLIEGLLAMIGGPIVMLAWIGIGYLLFRLARHVQAWSRGIAAGFAVLTVLMLVAMRLALYMVSTAPL
tara:strand:- start:2101 stop:2634 length:534 start_codon:yes stop_codon:yes gene_type:complete